MSNLLHFQIHSVQSILEGFAVSDEDQVKVPFCFCFVLFVSLFFFFCSFPVPFLEPSASAYTVTW